MIHLTFIIALVSLLCTKAVIAEANPSWPLPSSSCTEICGNVTILYPFGIGPGCFFDKWYEIECRRQREGFHVPFLKKFEVEVLNISITTSYNIRSLIQVRLPNMVKYDDESCEANAEGINTSTTGNNNTSLISLKGSPFYFSPIYNDFVAVGCDTIARFNNDTESSQFVGCYPKCGDSAVNTSKGGFGSGSDKYSYCFSRIDCCHTMVPYLLQDFTVKFMKKNKSNYSASGGGGCSYAFLVSNSYYGSLHTKGTLDNLPVTLFWGVVKELSYTNYNITQKEHFSCDALNGDYNDEAYQQNKRGLVFCFCLDGYEGNPYIKNGCQDVDECKDSNPCLPYQKCVNHIGGQPPTCVVDKKRHLLAVGFGTSLGSVAFILLVWGQYKIIKKRKERKLRQKYFKRNGGLLVQQQLSSSGCNVKTSKLFDLKDLEIATDQFNESRILGQGGQGTVYKGMLSIGEVVAIKKSTVIDEDLVEHFVNEIMILSQINHRNIVKILGFCLETKVPLLVYEYIPNGTLHQYIHQPSEEFSVSWEMRLQIATEVADAISYMHTAASMPIYHRDIKSSNILLDEKYRAKIADFGTSRSVSLEQTHVTTLVQGTFGYLDPEYFRSSQFTDKSDVYSFGVVLVELFTGEKPISILREPKERGLAAYFINSVEEDFLFDVVDAQVLKQAGKEEISKVANLAYRCLNLNSRKRPTMKEVATELEEIRKLRDGSTTRYQEGKIDHDGTEEVMETFHVKSSSSSFQIHVNPLYDAQADVKSSSSSFQIHVDQLSDAYPSVLG